MNSQPDGIPDRQGELYLSSCVCVLCGEPISNRDNSVLSETFGGRLHRRCVKAAIDRFDEERR
jgi:hypothetical protein